VGALVRNQVVALVLVGDAVAAAALALVVAPRCDVL